MPREDAERWNARYTDNPRFLKFERPRAFLIEHAAQLPTRGLALDMAMGLGGNAQFLLERGLKVVGVDISDAALRRAHRRLPELMAVLADLPYFYLPSATFDVILNFYFLERSLWPIYCQALKPGGLLVIETLTRDMLQLQPDIDPQFLLDSGELETAFPDLQILDLRRGWTEGSSGHRRAVESLLARKP